MTQELCEVLARPIRDAELVSLAGGLANVWKSNEKDKHTKAAYWNYDKQAHETLVPDADHKAITYFEERGATEITGALAGKYEARLTLIGWVNTMQGVNTVQLIEKLQQVYPKQFHSGNFRNIHIRFTALLPENEQLFSRYNYDSAVRKYLQKPYDAFGLQMNVSFNVNLEC